MDGLTVGTTVYKVVRVGGKLSVESATVSRVTPQLVWFSDAGPATNYRTRMDIHEAHRLARSEQEAAEKWLDRCSDQVIAANSEEAVAVRLLESLEQKVG
jgi:hypothetical protein